MCIEWTIWLCAGVLMGLSTAYLQCMSIRNGTNWEEPFGINSAIDCEHSSRKFMVPLCG